MLTSGTYIFYTVQGRCQTFTLHQGCYDGGGYYYSEASCSGSYVVLNAMPAPSSTPSVVPTGPSLVPSATPPSTVGPTGPSPMPSFTTAVNCEEFSVSYPDTVPCLFTACRGQRLSISSSSFNYGYAFLELYDSSGNSISISLNSLTLTTPMESSCQTYTLQQGCPWWYTGSCAGRFTVFGGRLQVVV